MTGRLLLVRHGQTTANVAQVLDTLPPGAPLTELGEQQARALVGTLAGRAIASVHASQARRAQQTAAPLAAARGLAVQVHAGVHETGVGELEGRSDEAAHTTFTDVHTRWLHGDRAARAPGGESGDDVLARYLPVVERLRAGLGEGDVVLVSHGAVIRLVAAALTDVDPGYAVARRLENTELVELVATAGGWECARWGTNSPPFRVPGPEQDVPDAL